MPTTPSAPPESLTVALVPTQRYDRIAALAARWVDAWLIDPLVLVRLGAAATSVDPGGGVVVVEGSLLTRGVVRPLEDLVAHLAGRVTAPEMVHVVDVALAADPGEEGVAAWTAMRREAETVGEVVRAAANRRPVRRIALIATDTGRGLLAGRLDDVPQPRWDVNVLAAAENRGAPGGWDAFVRRDDEEYDGFVLAHLATVAGLWSGVRSGSYDGDPRGAEGHLDLQRVTVRVVQHGDRRIGAARLAAHLLLGDPGPTAKGYGRIRAEDRAELGLLSDDRARRVLDEYARRVLDEVPGRPLRSRIDAAVRELAVTGTSWSEALRVLLRDLAGLARRAAAAPARLMRTLRGRRTEAPAGSGTIEADAAADGAARRRLAGLEAALERCWYFDPPGARVYSRDGMPSGVGSRFHAAGLWRQLHDPAVALLDGGDPPGWSGLLGWMRDQSFEGILPGPAAIVPDHVERWWMPPVVGRLLGLPEDGAGVSAGAADRITLRFEWARLQALAVRAREVLAAAGSDASGSDALDPEALDPEAPDPDAPDPEPDPDAVASEPDAQGAPGMTVTEAEEVVRADDELTRMLERLDATGVGRVQVEFAAEFGRLVTALETLRDRLAAELEGGSPRRLRDLLLRATVVPLVSLPVIALLPAALAALQPYLALLAIGAGGAFAVGGERVRRRGEAVGRAQRLVDLSGIADRVLDEWRRTRQVSDDLDATVVLLSHLLHHGALPAPFDAPMMTPLGHDDVPVLLRVAEPVEPVGSTDGDGTVPAGVDAAIRRCLEGHLVAGWRAALHDRILVGVLAGEPDLFDGMSVTEALDAEPRRAAVVLERISDARGALEQEVFLHLVEKGVRTLEGSGGDTGAAGPTGVADVAALRTAPGMPGSPSAKVRVLRHVGSSLDVRTDVLAPSLRDHPNWDAFLLGGVLPAGQELSDPWGAHVYARSREAADAHGRQRTEIHLPQRLIRPARRRLGGSGSWDDPEHPVTLVPLRDDQTRLVEVVVRVDTQPDPVSMRALGAFGATGEER